MRTDRRLSFQLYIVDTIINSINTIYIYASTDSAAGTTGTAGTAGTAVTAGITCTAGTTGTGGNAACWYY